MIMVTKETPKTRMLRHRLEMLQIRFEDSTNKVLELQARYPTAYTMWKTQELKNRLMKDSREIRQLERTLKGEY